MQHIMVLATSFPNPDLVVLGVKCTHITKRKKALEILSRNPPEFQEKKNQGPEKGSAVASSHSWSRLKGVTLRTQGRSVLPAGRDQQPEAEPPLCSHSGGAHVHMPELMDGRCSAA